MERQPAIYIMTNQPNGTLYVGVTSNLIKRVYEHKFSSTSGFAHKYGCKILAYYELIEDMNSAIMREKKLKAGSRKNKLSLINRMNPLWNDLYESLF